MNRKKGQKKMQNSKGISHEKLYSKYAIAKTLSLTNAKVKNLLCDIKPIKQGEQLLYNGLDILLKLNPDDDKLKLMQKNIGVFESRPINIRGI